MKTSSCSCSCGNLSIKGMLVPQCLNHNILKNGHVYRQTFFSIRSQSIEIDNFRNIKKCSLSKKCTNMKCLACGTTFRAILCNYKLYLEKTQPLVFSGQMIQNSNNCQMHCLHKNNNILVIPFPNIIHNLNCIQEDHKLQQNCFNQQAYNECNENETDIDIMFSNEDDPYVGSYKYHINDISNED